MKKKTVQFPQSPLLTQTDRGVSWVRFMHNVEFRDSLLHRLFHQTENDILTKKQVHAFDKQFNISRRSTDKAEEIPSL